MVPDYTVCVMANVFCMLDNARASINDIVGFMRQTVANASLRLDLNPPQKIKNTKEKQSMATLDELMRLPGGDGGVRVSGQRRVAGSAHRLPRAHQSKPRSTLLAHMCAANMSIATMQARGWEQVTAMKGFYPIQEFTLVGFDWSVVVSGFRREQLKQRGEIQLAAAHGCGAGQREGRL
jgi:roadblock/LC7 domain-containing protein